ncbi:MAG: hypothetical protein K2O18_02240 [Oscillospiraceae bacterium]|nr:hypothetical protein [Oscillospiraceae bacterium]
MPEKCSESPRDCPLLPRIEALEQDSRHNKDAHKEFYGKLEASHTNVALIEQRLNQIKEDTGEIKESVQDMKEKPAKRWESMVEKVLGAVALSVIAFLLGKVGL